ncbi:MAG: hypothetical protein GX950_03150 [Candidatus Diapherotrites archaeon]|uniref:Roadblock/LC7 domain-containing protein n=1 Tax=Candidatus Iainarchaeum sp. TaxID=3101447 RepID=A0A7K4C0D2_9ARCH|nr:hypothetical protein [Candidatus Diapherotrites archaeon]
MKRFAYKVLDVDTTQKPQDQVDFLQDFLSKHNYIFSNNFEENLMILKRKHLVDAFLVTNMDGSVVVSSEGDGINEGLIGAAMFSYIKGELPSSEVLMVKKEDGWFMVMPYNKKIFIVKAGSELSNIELKALAVDLSSFMSENSLYKKKAEQVAR